MIAILGGLGSAVAWAVSVLCSSRSNKIVDPFTVASGVMLVGLVVCIPIVASVGVPQHVGAGGWIWLFVSGAGNISGMVISYAAMRGGKISLIAPVTSMEGAVAAVIAVIAGEALKVGTACALVLAVVGVCMASIPHASERARPDNSWRRTAVLAGIAAGLFGLSLYATGRASDVLPSAWVVLSARVIGTASIGIPMALLGRLHVRARALPFLVASGLAEVAGFYSYSVGSRHGIAITAVLGSQFAAIAVAAAYFLFGERLSRVQLTGVCTIIAGVSLLGAFNG